MSGADVTVVMSPRERFNLTRRSIESLHENPGMPFDFICIDGGSPKAVRDYLRAESQRRGFRLIRTEHYLAPNEARNLAFDEIHTRYVVFVDNDVDFAPGWLKHLVDCAEETGAAIVSPLICIHEPVHTIVHMAGGDARIVTENGKRVFYEKHHFFNRPVAEVRDQLRRAPVELAEFHCMLARTDMLRRIGRFDENLKATAEHVDFCFQVREAGGTVMLEPRAVVTNVVGPPLAFGELPYFFYRWGDEWSLGSEHYFYKKWNAEYSDEVYRLFIRSHRCAAFPRLRAAARAVIGWRLGEWLFDRVADGFALWARRGREAVRLSP